jgi:transcriptional regulator with XRE-family HTH domain
MANTDGLDPRRLLADLMDDRRIDLDLTWNEVADRAGVSAMTLRRIRSGDGVLTRRTQRKIDRALEWQPGSVEGILSGREPSLIEQPDPADDDLRDELRERHRIDTRLFGLVEADRRLEADIARINADREKALERPQSA